MVDAFAVLISGGQHELQSAPVPNRDVVTRNWESTMIPSQLVLPARPSSPAEPSLRRDFLDSISSQQFAHVSDLAC